MGHHGIYEDRGDEAITAAQPRANYKSIENRKDPACFVSRCRRHLPLFLCHLSLESRPREDQQQDIEPDTTEPNPNPITIEQTLTRPGSATSYVANWRGLIIMIPTDNAPTYETDTNITADINITMDDDEIIGQGDEGFDDYIEQTTDTGDVPLIVVVVFGIITQFILLPVLVTSRRRYLRKKRRAESDEHDINNSPKNNQKQDQEKHQEENDDDNDESSNSTRPIVVEDDLPTLFDADPTRHHRHPTKNRRTADGRKRRVAQGIEEEGRISIMQRQDNQQEQQQQQEEEEEEEEYGGDDDIEDQMERQVELTDNEQDTKMSKPNGVNKKGTLMNTPDRSSSSCCQNILAESKVLFRFDNEARRILRLAIPFTLSELVDEVSEIVVLGIISMKLGTDALSAYAVFETLMEITTEFSGGVVDAMTTLASQAYGAGNNVLAGQYVQLCSMTYVLFQIPFILMWSFATFGIMIWMGFDENVAQMAQTYARLAVWRDTVLGVSEVYSNLFEVVEKEFAVAVIGNAEALVELGAIAIALFLYNGDLVTVGVIGILNGLCFFLLTLAFTYWRGWLKPFASGMFTSLSFKNRVAVKQVIKTATPLAFGSVLIHGEWEVLTVFAAYLGAAEVTAWAVLGNLWDIFESSNE